MRFSSDHAEHSDYCEECYRAEEDRRFRAEYVARWQHPDSRYVHNPSTGTVIHRLDGGCYSLDRMLLQTEPGYSHVFPAILTREQALATGKRPCLVCAPDIPKPPPKPRPTYRPRATGLGWPSCNGEVAKGRLPAHLR